MFLSTFLLITLDDNLYLYDDDLYLSMANSIDPGGQYLSPWRSKLRLRFSVSIDRPSPPKLDKGDI